MPKSNRCLLTLKFAKTNTHRHFDSATTLAECLDQTLGETLESIGGMLEGINDGNKEGVSFYLNLVHNRTKQNMDQTAKDGLIQTEANQIGCSSIRHRLNVNIECDCHPRFTMGSQKTQTVKRINRQTIHRWNEKRACTRRARLERRHSFLTKWVWYNGRHFASVNVSNTFWKNVVHGVLWDYWCGQWTECW